MGILIFISLTGNSKSTLAKILFISFSSSSMQLTGSTGTPYFSLNFLASCLTDCNSGLTEFKRTINGLLISFNSLITLSSASSYSERSISLIEPSVVMTRPIVEWSVMTFLVPISAAMSKGIASSNQGVFTMRGASSSM